MWPFLRRGICTTQGGLFHPPRELLTFSPDSGTSACRQRSVFPFDRIWWLISNSEYKCFGGKKQWMLLFLLLSEESRPAVWEQSSTVSISPSKTWNSGEQDIFTSQGSYCRVWSPWRPYLPHYQAIRRRLCEICSDQDDPSPGILHLPSATESKQPVFLKMSRHF